jgi:hypothetical protein
MIPDIDIQMIRHGVMLGFSVLNVLDVKLVWRFSQRDVQVDGLHGNSLRATIMVIEKTLIAYATRSALKKLNETEQNILGNMFQGCPICVSTAVEVFLMDAV